MIDLTFRAIFIGALIGIWTPVFADIDRACASDCMGRGYQYNYCNQACSYSGQSDQGFVPSGALGGWMAGEELTRRKKLENLEIERQKLEIERQRLELEILRRQQIREP